MEEAAASLGAGRLTTFRRVILPSLTPAIAGGAALSFARAVSEVHEKTFRVEHEVSVGQRRCASGFEVRAWVARPEAPGGALAARPIPARIVALLKGESRP